MQKKLPWQVGITGGIGSGKSIISNMFKCLGVPVYDADSRAKILMTTDGILIEAIKKEFGILSYEGQNLNRSYLSQVVFNDAEKLARLNSLVHPRVGIDYQNWVDSHQDSPYVLKEAALMIESGSGKSLDTIIFVSAPEDLRIRRVMQRDPQRSRQQVESIIRNQMPDEEKVKHAQAIVVNDESTLVLPQVLKLDAQFRKMAVTM